MICIGLIVSAACLMLNRGDLPTWLRVILTSIYFIFYITAVVSEHRLRERVRNLENTEYTIKTTVTIEEDTKDANR